VEFREALSRAAGDPAAITCPTEPREFLVGRRAEIEAIEEVLRGTAAGASNWLWFTGPPGIGKSKLLSEARLRAQLRGQEAVQARFFPDAPTAGPLLVESLRSQIGAGPGAEWIDSLSSEHGGSSVERARRSAQSFFAREGNPLVLCLDDLHFADRQSRLLVEALLAECSHPERHRRALGLFIASASHPSPANRSRTRLLEPLGLREARQLFRSLLGSLRVPAKLAGEAAVRSGGSPRRLDRLARALLVAWGASGDVPPGARVPDLAEETSGKELRALLRRDRCAGQALQALAVLRQPSSTGEIAAVAGLDLPEARRALARLEEVGAVMAYRPGRIRLHALSGPSGAGEVLRGVSPEAVVRMHQRAASFLRGRPGSGPTRLEHRARSLLLGCSRRGLAAALQAARALRGTGLFVRALSLLADAAATERKPGSRLILLKEMSAVLEEMGDHAEGVALLEPVYRSELAGLPRREAVGLRRRLGVHYHRSGRIQEALSIFQEAQAAADPSRDLEELIIIDAELAELCIFQGQHDRAREACAHGLGRLEALRGARPDFRERMEVTLRASLGHLELRRLALPSARRELRRALELAGRFTTTVVRAMILNNLGIVENQLNRFAAARRAFREAERLLLAAGERRVVIEIACNLAVIAAKLGVAGEARAQVGRAAELLRQYPGQRIEFFVPYVKGLVALLLGEPAEAIEALEPALRLGRRLGDLHLTRFGEVYLAEAQLLCGRYALAARRLRATGLEAGEDAPPVLVRMIRSRLFLAEVLLGRMEAARRSRLLLEATPPSAMALLEAWNGLFAGLACALACLTGTEQLDAAREAFRRLKVPHGERLARAALVAEALFRGDLARARGFLLDPAGPAHGGQRLLAVLEPLVEAEAHFQLGETEQAKELLSRASAAIVGTPFLELDWWLEFLRARRARRLGDLEGARGYLHRSLHTRDLLLQQVPGARRKRFLAQPRFAALAEQARLLEKAPRLVSSTERLRRSDRYEGMVGASEPMLGVFRSIERLRRQEVPVLIIGETGTGKELAARAIHRTGPRADAPFLALHCGSLPEPLFEAELFGHEAGAFTGAEEARPGILEGVSGGTLLLDEVSALPPASQAKLLRSIDSGLIRRVGGVEPLAVDVRWLASSSADLRERVEAGAFRKDLYYRLARAEIRLPPLRERKGDLLLLARHFLAEEAARLERAVPTLTPEAAALLEAHSWPGNVRELETILIRSLFEISTGEAIGPRVLERLLPRARTRDAVGMGAASLIDRSLGELKLELERAYLTQLFRELGGDLRKVMARLGIRRSRLYLWLRRLGLDVRDLRSQ
jgi:DNA-binding NtrC family response regulator/DNA-binding transcriptional ArsR family regulator